RARELVERNDRRWDAVYARHQTAGRGRQGAHWYDTPGLSMLVSLILWETPTPEPIWLTGLLAALATAQALEAHYPALPLVQLKYPNDVMLHGRKLGGVLTEVVEGTAIVGIGVNLGQTQFPPDLAERAISVRMAVCSHLAAEFETPPTVDALILTLYQNLLRLLERWRTHPDEVVLLWRARDDSIGRAYRIYDLPEQPVGVALGVVPDFRLHLRLPNGTEHTTYYVSAV
ncbi:MAG: biotin--[acetyl-CoA-carboxylase] ligase, partial [Fimbriimonadales bacterium]